MANNTVTCSCYQALEDKKREIEEESFAMANMKEYAKASKRWFTVAVITLISWLSTILGFLVYIN